MKKLLYSHVTGPFVLKRRQDLRFSYMVSGGGDKYKELVTEVQNLLEDDNKVYYLSIHDDEVRNLWKIFKCGCKAELNIRYNLNLSEGTPDDEPIFLLKECQSVNSEIEKYIRKDAELKSATIYDFDEDGYNLFLKDHNIQYPILDFSMQVSKECILNELLVEEEEVDKMLSALRYKKNIILQGPPGVGKTFIAKRLAYLMMDFKENNRIQMVQFHQSYSYEDFIQGYKPETGGGFKLKNGVFYNFCKTAQADPTYEYFFIIDEINRGNLSKVFGELMMLIEHDKRGPEYAIPLTYSENGDTFYIPKNLHIIGMMNTADRSLAVVDYALRRRFAFITMVPKLDKKLIGFLIEKGIREDFANFIANKILDLNKVIENDLNLGKGFLIGHSYFCTSPQDNDFTNWYNQIIDNEIKPMLEEYWYDDLEKAYEEVDKLYYNHTSTVSSEKSEDDIPFDDIPFDDIPF